MKIFVSDQADADLLQIISYLLERNPGAARSVAHEIDKKFENLSHFPFIGRERSTLAPGLRSVVAGTNVIFYLVESDRITIVRVLDGRRDIDAEFRR
ncbi:MAG TPA: type II toxin-antitoxin system RelE/ParE family toxin [Xanthobacteraceae bacterium]